MANAAPTAPAKVGIDLDDTPKFSTFIGFEGGPGFIQTGTDTSMTILERIADAYYQQYHRRVYSEDLRPIVELVSYEPNDFELVVRLTGKI